MTQSKIVQGDFGGNINHGDTSAQAPEEQSSALAIPDVDITKPVFTEEELDPNNWDTYRDHDGNEFKINPEFRHLIPSPDPDELEELEVQLKAFGCREPLVTWRGMLLDGHNRLEICKEHTIPFKTVSYDDKIANVHRARIWIRANNRGRRNINNFTKVRWALEDKEDLAAEAREKQLSGLKQFQDTDNQNTTVDPNSGQGSSNDMLGRTDRKIAESAGVGHNTVHQVTSTPPPVTAKGAPTSDALPLTDTTVSASPSGSISAPLPLSSKTLPARTLSSSTLKVSSCAATLSSAPLIDRNTVAVSLSPPSSVMV